MNKHYLKWGLGVAAVAAAGVLLDSLVLEKYFFDVKHFDIGEGKSGKVLKLALLTDLHLKHHLYPQHRRLASRINQLKPDLLLITGYTLDSMGKASTADEFLGLINDSIPKAAIPGNHDHLAADSLAQLQEAYVRHNCQLLVNTSKAYTLQNTRLMVTGLDDFIRGKSNVPAALEGVGTEQHHLLLIHSPLQQEQAMSEISKLNQQRAASEKVQVSYIFAGHSHGGQVRLPGYVPVHPKKSGDYLEGWYNSKPPYLYVSKGFGTSRLPVRFLARSEMVVFNYHV
ncbi:MAG: metallophosphoesterase [Pontibacter sp.]|nr:metallophosphoesterase [Pontibacter sp.]